MPATYQKANGRVQDDLKILFSLSLALFFCRVSLATLCPSSASHQHAAGHLRLRQRVRPHFHFCLTDTQGSPPTHPDGHRPARFGACKPMRQPQGPAKMAGDEAPSQLLRGGKPETAPPRPICSPSVTGGGQAGSQIPPRGGCGTAVLSPHHTPQPEESSRLDFILLFQPLPPATRQQKAGSSSTALKQSRGFL